MNRKPIIAIVGRPNVGKSTFVNRLVGKRQSIVDDRPGVTRDRIYFDVEWQNRPFTVIDTGGIIPGDEDEIMLSIYDQAKIACEEADKIIFIVDGLEGVTPVDSDIANILRQSNKPIFLAVNKVDSHNQITMISDFYSLAIGEPIAISALHGSGGVGDLLEEITSDFEYDVEEEEDKTIKIAIVGRPNAGKSSIINKLLGEERVIVSPVAGTTRDAIDTTVKRNGQEYIFIDTAGLRRKIKIKEELERYSIIRTVTAVERCDVAVLIIDATEGITEQDAKIAGIAHERGKGMIIAVNKWDLVEKDNTTMKKFTEKIREKLSYMPYAELIFLSAKTGQRLPKLFDMIDAVIENCALRVQTGVLNEILTEAMAMKQPPSDKGKRLRIYYITQVSVKPPTFVMFINEKKLTHFSYTRYIENQIRTTFGFRGTPIHFIYRERKEK